MAAGVIYQTVTTTSGETVELAFYVDDTVSPTTWTPVSRLASDSPGVITTGTAGSASAVVLTVQGIASMTPLLATAAGGVAHDGADSGNPVKVGARARSSEVSAVSNDDRVDLVTDLVGKLIVLPYANPENFVSGATSVITDTTSTSVIAAQGAGVRTYVTSITVTNSDASVGTTVTITDGSGGTALYRGYAAAAGGGFSVTFPTPLKTTANTALHAVCGTTSSETYVSAAGYKGA